MSGRVRVDVAQMYVWMSDRVRGDVAHIYGCLVEYVVTLHICIHVWIKYVWMSGRVRMDVW